MKPKILLVPDLPKWCYDHCSNQIIKHLGHKYDFTKVYNYTGKEILPSIDPDPYDLVFRFIAYRIRTTDKVPKHKLLTSIRSYNSVERRLEDFTSEVMTNTYNAISVVAKSLRALLPEKCCPCFDTPNGVDTDLFKPIPDNHNFTIGFAGNSKHPNQKGMDLIIEAARLAGVQCKLADRNDVWIPHSEMPDYYKDIDVYICASLSEGFPNSVLEALACGKPVISTPVGGVPECVKTGYNGILIDRKIECLVEAIQLLKRDKELYDFMATNARKEVVKNWQWKDIIKNYEKFFDFALSVIPERFVE